MEPQFFPEKYEWKYEEKYKEKYEDEYEEKYEEKLQVLLDFPGLNGASIFPWKKVVVFTFSTSEHAFKDFHPST